MRVQTIRQIKVGDTEFEVHEYEEVKDGKAEEIERRASMFTAGAWIVPMILIAVQYLVK